MTEKTDAEHSVTTQEIIDYRAWQGINAERKSIYTDIDLLIDYGMDSVKNSGRSGGYTLVSRQFELAELKLSLIHISDNPGTNNCYIIHIKSSLFCEAKSEPLWARRGFSLLVLRSKSNFTK